MGEPEYDFPNNRFSPWDYVVFALVLVISAGIGVFYAILERKNKATTQEFLMAGRKMSVIPVALSLLASFMSAITLLGTPAEIYTFGTEYWMIWIGYVLLIPVAAHVFIPIFFRLKITSVFEYLEMRFNRTIRIYCACLFLTQMTLYMAIVLYTPSLALNVVTGINKWLSVVTVGTICTFYTAIGGMKAVMWTDVFQVTMMFAGLVAVLIKGAIDHDGFANIWRYLEEGDRVEFFVFDPNPLLRHSIWSLSIGGAFTWLAIYGVNQAQIQRALCVPHLRQAQIAMWINLPGLFALLTVCSLCGAVVYAEYKDCDPVTAGRIEAKDQLLPQYVMDRLAYPGLPGLFTACLFSGALSTISSGLNSLSAVTLQDLVKLLWFKDLTEERATLATKFIALGFGVLMMTFSFLASQLGGVLQAALGLFGMIGGPVLGVYILGVIYPLANSKGALCGLTSGLLVALWLGIAAIVYSPTVPKKHMSIEGCPRVNASLETTEPWGTTMYMSTEAPYRPEDQPGYLSLYELSYMWLGTVAVGITNIVGLTVSIATGGWSTSGTVDRKLICPIFDVFCCYLPASWRRKLWCGVDHDQEDADDEIIQKEQEPGKTHNGFHNPAMEKTDTPSERGSVSVDHVQYETHL